MKKSEQIHVTGLNEHLDALEQLCEHNEDYDLTASQMAARGMVGKRIYENVYRAGSTTLSVRDGAADPPQIDVVADSLVIGQVKLSQAQEVKKLMDSSSLISVSIHIQGGPYRIVDAAEDRPDSQAEDGAPSFVLDEGSAGLFAMLTIEYDEREESFADDSDAGAYISTTYATEVLEKDQKKRGNGALLFSAMLAIFYLGFSVPYWVLIWRGQTAPLDVLGGSVPQSDLYIHLIAAGCALVLNILSYFMTGSVIPLLAAALYAGGAWTVPGYAIFTALPALLCLAASFRRKSSRRLTVLKFLVLAACLVCLVYEIRPTVMNALQQHTFTISPQNHFSSDESGLYDDSFDEIGDNEYSDETDASGDDYSDDEEYFDGDADLINLEEEQLTESSGSEDDADLSAALDAADEEAAVQAGESASAEETEAESTSPRTWGREPALRPGSLIGRSGSDSSNP